MLFANAELRRSKVRFGMLTAGTGLLVFVLLFQQALLTSVLDGMAGAITHQSAPVLVLSREAQGAVAGSSIPGNLFEAVSSSPGVADAAEMGFIGLSFRQPDAEERHSATFIGYRPDRAGSPTQLASGRLPEGPNEVVASTEDSAGRYRVGETIVVEPGQLTLEVVGLTSESRMNIGPTFWTLWETYQDMVQRAFPGMPSWATVVAVVPAAGVEPEQLASDLNAAQSDLEALTREAAVTDAPGRDAVRYGFLLVIVLGHVVVAVVIGFFFLTLTLQKERSITLLRAIGARASYVIGSLLRQVVVVMVGGIAIGALLLVGVESLVRATVPITVDPTATLRTAVPVVAVGLLAVIPPIRRVLRTDPQAAVSRPSFGGAG